MASWNSPLAALDQSFNANASIIPGPGQDLSLFQQPVVATDWDSWDWAIGTANLIGSISSFFGSGFIVLTYLILPIKRHFRHSLILNLAIADFLTAMNNTISGSWRLAHNKEIPDGMGCVFNGFLEQLSVQATDCSILAIALVTVWSLTRRTLIAETLPLPTTFLICCSTWILPLFTAFTALALNKYVPVSGNWCWIAVQPIYDRYLLMHAWRFLFILIEIMLYTYLHFYLRKRFAAIMSMSRSSSGYGATSTLSPSPVLPKITFTPTSLSPETPRPPHTPLPPQTSVEKAQEDSDSDEPTTWYEDEDEDDYEDFVEAKPDANRRTIFSAASLTLRASKLMDPIPDSPTTPVTPTPAEPPPGKRKRRLNFRFAHPFAHRSKRDDDLGDHEGDRKKTRNNNSAKSRRVRRILLLNAYPAMYILLWIPGIINRFMEATGHGNNVTAFLQASTQFIGIANAITYGWNERVGRQLREHINERWSGHYIAGIRETLTNR
ncbi:hypothetical protein TWF694_004302 [Orbilia ellipsospora]|uniref:G-protein coupled receptors family 1 profile domain-containing protein n=1 Tax=Orbilia ellipsospora TaxID=2528407 RepID=A0AAV9WXP4_9PEZI